MTNTNDNGVGSLRYEVALGEAAGGSNTISFASSALGQITLTSGEIDVTNQSLLVNGPGETALAISGNSNSRIFHVENGSLLALSGLTLENGSVSGSGGAILVDTPSATAPESLNVTNVEFLQNHALTGGSAGIGGAIAFEGSTTLASSSRIINSQFLSNTSGSIGGAVDFRGGSILVQNSTFSQNSSSQEAGAFSADAGSAMVQSSTFDSNTAITGGAILKLNTGSLGIFAATITRNTATFGGGIYNSTATVISLQDSIVAGNNASTGPDIDSKVNSLGYNLFKSIAGITFTTGQQSTDIVSATPGIGTLGNYSGPTLTDPLLPGSPALMHGLNDNGGSDQRGVALIVPSSYSIGAFYGAGFLVTTNGDNGGTNPAVGAATGTLRQALTDADFYATGDGQATVAFAIPGTGAQTISVLAPLPDIATAIDIDASTQPGYASSPLVNLLEGTGSIAYGLRVTADFATIRALAIGGFVTEGVVTNRVNALTVAGDYFGLAPDGSTAEPNNTGLVVDGSNILIGGPNPTDSNVFANNTGDGLLFIDGTGSNLVENNLVGLTPTGASAPNGSYGIELAAMGVTVGSPSLGNLVENNLDQGIDLDPSSGSDIIQSNTLINNGNIASNPGPHRYYGLNINSNNNTIGGTDATYANVFSQTGVGISNASGNLLENNRIGTDIAGTFGVGTLFDGVDISGGSSHNTIGAGNIISANTDGDGVYISGAGTAFNLVTNCFIGTDITGNNGLYNNNGVEIQSGASNNTVTGSVISGNTSDGVVIHDTGTTGNVVSNNKIGTNAAGTLGGTDYGLENDNIGVEFYGGPTNNTVTGNVISGNTAANLQIGDLGSSNNLVQNNLIGTDVTGEIQIADTSFFGNNYGVEIIGQAAGNTLSGNVISGNGNDGIFLGNGANNNQIVSNTIGLDKLKQVALNNHGNGINIAGGPNGLAFQNKIGGAGVLGNVIAGNSKNGVAIGAEPAPTGLTNWISGDGTTLDTATGASATINGMVGYVNAQQGQGFSFGGAGSVNTGLAAFGSNNFSVSFSFETTQSGQIALVSDADNSGDGYLDIGLLNGRLFATVVQPGVTSFTMLGPLNLNNGNFHQVVLTRSGPSFSLYVDNGLSTQSTQSGINIQTPQSLLIGDSAGDASRGESPFQGVIDQFQVYNRSLSLPDVTILDNPNGLEGGNVIQGNKIGTDGNVAYPNQRAGIATNGSSYDLIGGIGTGQGNTISGNLLGGVTLSNPNLPSGLSSVYSAEGNALDSWGNADGQIVGTVGYAPGKIGQAFNFPSGQDNHVTVNPAALGSSDFTISFDIQTLDAGANVPLYGNKATAGLGNFLDISLQSGTIFVDIDDGTTLGRVQLDSTVRINNGAYHLVTVVRQSTSLMIYVDGTLNSASTGSIEANLTAASPFEIGSEPLVGIMNSPTYTSFVGQIDEVQVYHQALQLSDVQSLVSDGNEGGARIFGNFIGTNTTGNLAIPNGLSTNGDSGLVLYGTENGDIIGGTLAGAGNLLAGNYGSDLDISGELTSGVLVQGNLIGLDANGDAAISGSGSPNTEVGIRSGGNTIGGLTAAARNVIAGGGLAGESVELDGQSATGNLFEGDYVGTDKTGTINLASYYGEIVEFTGARGNTYGGTVAGAGNLVVGMGHQGVNTGLIFGTSDDLVAGNLLDTNALGSVLLGQTFYGIRLTGSNNTIGGTVAAARNVLPTDAIDVQQNDNLVEGNYVGFDATGLNKLASMVYAGISAEGNGNTIGGTVAGAGNVIGNTAGDGIDLDGGNSTGNLVEGNLVGTDKTGLVSALITRGAIVLSGGAHSNTIGGVTAAARNVFVALMDLTTDQYSGGNLIEGNFFGTDSTGNAPLTNDNGLYIVSSGNTIGGTVAGAGNIITAEGYGQGDPSNGVALWIEVPGDTGNLVEGNRIGLGVNGAVIGGASNVGIRLDGSSNTIGGSTAAARNVIAGTLGGLQIEGSAANNVVEGNYIGTDTTGEIGLGNGNSLGGSAVYYGVEILGGTGNTIGGLTLGTANVLSSNYFGAFLAGGTNNTVEGNLIGTDAMGTRALPNNTGIRIASTANTVGGTAAGAGNVIAFNQGSGIEIQTTGAAYSSVRQNRIVGNGVTGISVTATSTSNPSPFAAPGLVEASVVGQDLTVRGTSVAGAVLEFFVAAAGQGDVYLGTGSEGSIQDNNAAIGSYLFSFTLPSNVMVLAGDSITAISVATPFSVANPSLQSTTSPFALAVTSDSGPAFGGPVVNAGGGGTIVVGTTFTSQGSFTDTTSESWTATIDYHDITDGTDTGPLSLAINPITLTPGSGDQYSEIGDGTYNISHKFTKVGNYSVTIRITNDSGEATTSGFTVNVVAAPPVVNDTGITLAPALTPTITTSPAIINETQSVVLNGKFADVTPGTTHSVIILWGDGNSSPATVNEAAGTFTATHPYLTPGSYNSASGLFTVEAQITSSAGTSASTTFGLFYVQVNDVAPSNLMITTSSTTVTESATSNFSLSGSFTAPGPLDSHVVTINWGDGSPNSTITLGPGVVLIPVTAHDYRDYSPSGVGKPYPVQVSVNDFYQPLSPATATATVVVNPAPVLGIVLTTSVSTISQGGTFSVSGAFNPPGPLDHHEVVINWGDGTTSAPIFLGSGVTSFPSTTHTYAKNSLGQTNGQDVVTVTITDPIAPGSTTAVTSTAVTVTDVASTITGLGVTYADGTLIAGNPPQVNAGSTVLFTGNYTTPNPLDSYTLLINWGDGTTSAPITYLPTATSSGRFTATHYYADSNAGSTISLDDIHVTVIDKEGTTGTGDLNLSVAHVSATDQIRSGSFSSTGAQILTAAISGGDTDPIVAYDWYLVVGTTTTLVSTSSSYTLPILIDTDYTIESVAFDSRHFASNTFKAMVHVLDNTSKTYQVADPGPGYDTVFVSALGGNDTIVGGTVRMNADGSIMTDAHGIPILATTDMTPIIFDGNGQETYIGDNANDVFYLHTDLSKAYGEGGNNTFVLTPNCTLEADVESGQNTIDFSTSTYGVTFSLAATTSSTPVKQDVDPIAQPDDHFVIASASGTGSFSTLIGSNHSDTFTAASNTTIDTGVDTDKTGVNTVLISSTTANTVGNVNVNGSSSGTNVSISGTSVGNVKFQGVSTAAYSGTADGDVLMNSGSISGTVIYNGGADSSLLTNMGTISGTVTYNGGADGATLTNLGSIGGTVIYNGGADGAVLANMGTISGTVTYGPGSDASSLVNATSSVNSLTNAANALLNSVVFNGGADASVLTNMGTIAGTVTYNSGSDSDKTILATNKFLNGGTIANVNFVGNTGSDLLTNNGIITGTLGYNGGDGSDQIVNNNSIGNLIYNGGADSGTLTNTGTIAGTVTYNGGSDTDLLSNKGSISGTVSYNGGSDSGSLMNAGTIAGTVIYNGGSDADSLTNLANAMIGSVVFRGGSDSSTLMNMGTISGTVMYGGGSDSNVFTNSGSVGGTVIYNGGADSGSLMNLGTISGSVTYNGGSDTDLLSNMGTISGSVIYNGGSDSGTLVNAGTIAGTVSYGGGSDSNSFLNSGLLLLGVNYTGGADTGLLTNMGTISGTVTYNGGSDSQVLTNQGTISGTVTYNGGSDTDTLVNMGTIGGTVVYNGGSDSGNLVNMGTISGTVTYNGGSDSDILTNQGTIGGTVIFNGGADSGATVGFKQLVNSGLAGAITFNGGLGAIGTTNNLGELAGADTLANLGTVTGAITFFGDGQAAQLLNASGATAGSIRYTGGSSTNLLLNQGTVTSSITFNAGGDGSVLSNAGTISGTVTYNGGSDSDLLLNTGNGGGTLAITYNGGSDSGTFINSGSGLQSITYTGGSRSATLINEGSSINQIQFTSGSNGGGFVNAGNNVGAISYTDGASSSRFNNVFRNDGLNVGALNYSGANGSGYVLNNGSVGTISYVAGSAVDALINNGTAGSATAIGVKFQGASAADEILNTTLGTITGLSFLGGTSTNDLENDGTLSNATANFGTTTSAGQFLNALGAIASNVTYDAGADTDAFLNYGSLNGATYHGGIGVGSTYLDGTVNTGVTYFGGANGDEVFLGPDAASTSAILFQGGGGADMLVNETVGAQGITYVGGSSSSTFWSLANNASGLTFVGGSGTNTFVNTGSGVTGINFTGGSGLNTLTNSGANDGTIVDNAGAGAGTLTNSGVNTTSITYYGGKSSDTLLNTAAATGVGTITFVGATGTDLVTNNANNVGLINVTGGTGSDSLTNAGNSVGAINFIAKGPSASFIDSGSVGSLTFAGGAGFASLNYSAIGGSGSTVKFTGQGGGNSFVDSGTATTATASLGSGNNQYIIMTGATGTIILTGGDGNNSYYFSGTPHASVTINQALFADIGSVTTSGGTPVYLANPANTTGGVDTLDFSGYLGGGVVVDLMNLAPQSITGGLTLTLIDPEGISSVIGSQYTNQVFGNYRPDNLSTSYLPDTRVATVQANTAPAFTPDARTQYVFLDFDTYTVAGDMTYSTSDRAAILAAIQADYYGTGTSRWFDVDIEDNLSLIPTNTVHSGNYAILDFNRTPPSGLPGGEASEIDPGNSDFGGYASIQINGMIGGGDQPTATDANFIALSAKIGAHELEHLMGVRHSDAFGPIGYGVHTPPGLSSFNPTYDGPADAFETYDHIISSPATVGSTRFNDLRGLDFGPREAIKLSFASQGTTVVASAGAQSTMATAKPINLASLNVPNTDITLNDVEKTLYFQVGALDVQGTIGLNPTTGQASPDYYALTGQKGDVDTIEVESQEDARVGTTSFDTVVGLYDAQGNLIAFNDDQYEGTDSLLMDVTLPATGTYYIRVSSFAATAGNPEYDPTNPISPLNPANLQSDLNPLNPDYSPTALAQFLQAKAGTETGQYDLFVYRFDEADPTAANTNNLLVARGAGSTLSGSTGTDTLIGPAGTIFNDTNGAPSSAIGIVATVASPTVDLNSSSLDTITLTGPTGTIAWNVTVSYGDGTSSVVSTVPAGSSIPLVHRYQAIGNYTVTMTIQTSVGTFGTSLPVTIAMTQAPAESITGPTAGSTYSLNTPVTFSGSVQNPYVGVSYLATWTFTSTTNASQVLTTTQTVSTSSATSALAFSTTESFPNSGTYRVQLTIKNLANNLASTVSSIGSSVAQVVILQTIGTTTTATAPGSTYSGKPYAGASASVVGADKSVVSSPTVTYLYYLSTDTGLKNPLSAAPTDAGSYLVVASFAGNASYNPSTSQPVGFTIAVFAPKLTASATSITYTASPYALATGTLVGVNNTTIAGPSLKFVYSSGTTVLPAAPTDAGTYTVVASYAGSLDYSSTTSAAVTFTIAQALPTVTPSAANTTYTAAPYAGASATVTGIGGVSIANAAVVFTYYASGSTTALGSAPTDAGSYTVTATYLGTTDYSAVTSTSVSFAIARFQPSIKANPANATYTASPYAGASASVLGVAGASITTPTTKFLYYSGSTLLSAAPTDAGTYTVVASYAGSIDYGSATSAAVSFVIAQASPTVTPSAANTTYTAAPYAGASATVTGVGGASITTPAVKLVYYSGTTLLSAAPTDAGTYTVVASYAGSTDYYAATSITVTFTIAPVAPTSITATPANASYTASPYAGASASVIGLGGVTITTGTIKYAYSSGGAPLSAPPTDAGSYTVVASYGGSTDYSAATSAPVTFTIAPVAPKSVTATPANTNYTAAPYAGASAIVIGLGNTIITTGTIKYLYSLGGTPLSAPPTDAGTYTVVASYGGSIDYGSATSAPVTFTIARAAPTSVTASATSLIYNGATYAGVSTTVIGLGGSTIASPTVTYAYANASGTPLTGAPVDAGTYSVIATFAGNTDYSSASARSVSFSIAQVNPTLTLSAANATYTASAYALASASVTGLNGTAITTPAATFSYATTASPNTPLSAPPTGVGSYQVVASFAGTVDYKAITASATFLITAAPLTVTITDAAKAYGLASATLTGSIAGIQGKDAISAIDASAGSLASANIGTYPITATLSDGGTGALANYAVTYKNSTGTQTTGTLTVTPAATTTVVSSTSATNSYASPVTFLATITDTVSTTPPTGSVEFYDGTTDLGHGVLNYATGNYANWTLVSATLSPGQHPITAVYTPTPITGGSDFQASSSKASPYLETIVGGATATTLSTSAATINFGQAETFTATVLVGSTGAPGTVDFYDSTTSTDLGVVTLNGSGVATLTTAVPLPSGTQSILASYAGGSGYTASSATATVSVLASIYVLNPTLAGALNISGSSSITVPGLVQVDSNSTSAILESGNTKTSAAAIRVVGGYSVSGSSTFSTTPVKGAASVSDPLANLPIPSATGMVNYGSIYLGGVSTMTINPGIYSSINVTASASLKMNPGVYVITGGGFAVNGAASVTGTGVTIYNAGSNYNGGTPGTYGGITIDGSGKITLSAPTTGIYAGIVIFQSRDNARLVELSGATVASLNGGAVYAAAAQLNLSGSAQLGTTNQPASPLVVNQLVLSGNVTADLRVAGGGEEVGTAGQLIAGDVAVYVDNHSGGFTADELSRIADAVASADATVAPFGSDVYEVSDPSLATTVISIGATSPSGSAADGVLGCEVPSGIDLVTGWNWYTGTDPSQVGAGQYDFETIVLHEIGHALGLGHSPDPTSAMFATLDTGLAKRSLVTADLDIPDSDNGPCALHASTDAGLEPETTTGETATITPSAPVLTVIPIAADPIAIPTRKTDAPARPAPAVAIVRTRPLIRRGSALDRAIDQWDDEADDLIDGVARELARSKATDAMSTLKPA